MCSAYVYNLLHSQVGSQGPLIFLALMIFKELTIDVKCSVFVQRSVLNLLEMLLLPYDLGLVSFV